MSKKTIIFATNNRHKLEEVQRMLGDMFEILSPADMGIFDDIPETALTLEGNAEIKARHLYELTNINCFADDTGLEVEALRGAPGVFSARYAGIECNHKKNVNLLLRNMKDKSNRSARFRTAICYIENDREHFFEGVVYGTIRDRECGDEGFGYDPIFQPDGYDVTFAEMDMDSKNKISHRGRAIEALVDYLKRRK